MLIVFSCIPILVCCRFCKSTCILLCTCYTGRGRFMSDIVAVGRCKAADEVLCRDDCMCAAPEITEGPGDVTEFVDNRLMLACSARGDPRPTIQWQKRNGTGGRWIQVTRTSERYRVQRSGNLVIRRLLASDAGLFRCVAENAVGSAYSAAATLVVQGLCQMIIYIIRFEDSVPRFMWFTSYDQVTDVLFPSLVARKFVTECVWARITSDSISLMTSTDTSHVSLPRQLLLVTIILTGNRRQYARLTARKTSGPST